MRVTAGLVAVTCLVGRTLHAQDDASVGAGAGTVRYPGGSNFSSASLSPAAQFVAGLAAGTLWSSVATLPDGLWSLEGRGDLTVTTDPRGGLRAAIDASGGASDRSDGLWSLSTAWIGEAQLSIGRVGLGVGAGPSAGWSSDTTSVVALHLRLRGWRAFGSGAVSVAVEPTRLEGSWFTDVGVTATIDRGPVTASLWTAVRVSQVYGSAGGAGAWVQVFVSPQVSLEFGGGSYLPDLFLNLPRAGFVAAGARVHLRPRLVVPQAPVQRGAGVGLTRVRFNLANAQSAAIAGDWNAWHPEPLQSAGNGVWERNVTIAPGLYHFSLLVDGVWIVPPGVPRVDDGFGGVVGVLDVH
ncbi:MAG TPA: glycogen-binding domain-containing protein [Gemmatimonadales bacterium]|nr:glycogen-binding domain-containing protein [Gemmatimonadales bacterium]